MFIERRDGERRSLSDLRSWEERRRNVRRRFIKDIDEDLRSGNDQRQQVRRIEIRRLGLDRRSWEFRQETCYS